MFYEHCALGIILYTPEHFITVTIICQYRLLREPAPALNRLPGRWLVALLERVRAPGQGRDDIVRRSGGLPFAFVALFLAEPIGSHKVHISLWPFAILPLTY